MQAFITTLLMLQLSTAAMAQQFPYETTIPKTKKDFVLMTPGMIPDGDPKSETLGKLTNVIGEQTDTIKALSERLKNLENRIEKLESSTNQGPQP